MYAVDDTPMFPFAYSFFIPFFARLSNHPSKRSHLCYSHYLFYYIVNYLLLWTIQYIPSWSYYTLIKLTFQSHWKFSHSIKHHTLLSTWSLTRIILYVSFNKWNYYTYSMLWYSHFKNFIEIWLKSFIFLFVTYAVCT